MCQISTAPCHKTTAAGEQLNLRSIIVKIGGNISCLDEVILVVVSSIVLIEVKVVKVHLQVNKFSVNKYQLPVVYPANTTICKHVHLLVLLVPWLQNQLSIAERRQLHRNPGEYNAVNNVLVMVSS